MWGTKVWTVAFISAGRETDAHKAQTCTHTAVTKASSEVNLRLRSIEFSVASRYGWVDLCKYN